MLKSLLVHPLAKGVKIDDANAVVIHKKILDSKPLLQRLYRRWYAGCQDADRSTRHLNAPVLEIGCGAGFLEEYIPGLIKSDVDKHPYCDRVVDAMNLDFPDQSLRAIFMVGVLHHLSEPARFLSEARRCLKPGGRVVMIEPANNLMQKWLCRLLDHYEYLDANDPEWVNRDSGRMSSANLALPWIIFVRDRERLNREFPEFKIKSIRHHTFLYYWATGGMTFRSFLPGFCGPLLDLSEKLADPWMEHLGVLMTIDLEKNGLS
ncbi:class I SAM-dependent methyltransferase [bacterium]|nr:class I SAM-dependent methyltransferase [bacterium]